MLNSEPANFIKLHASLRYFFYYYYIFGNKFPEKIFLLLLLFDLFVVALFSFVTFLDFIFVLFVAIGCAQQSKDEQEEALWVKDAATNDHWPQL